MIILAIRTDKPEAELHLVVPGRDLLSTVWQAHRELSDTIHLQIDQLLNKSRLGLKDIDGIIYFVGPGSFTGLRIGASVANSFAYSIPARIVGAHGDSWLSTGQQRLDSGEDDKIIVPYYGAEPRITKQKK